MKVGRVIYNFGLFSALYKVDKHNPRSSLNLEVPVVNRCHKACDDTVVFSTQGLPVVKCSAEVWFRYEGL